jgi:hypothetical protein
MVDPQPGHVNQAQRQLIRQSLMQTFYAGNKLKELHTKSTLDYIKERIKNEN